MLALKNLQLEMLVFFMWRSKFYNATNDNDNNNNNDKDNTNTNANANAKINCELISSLYRYCHRYFFPFDFVNVTKPDFLWL